MTNATQYNFESLKGQPVWEIFSHLLGNHTNIREIRVQTYLPAPKLSERLREILSEHELEILQKVDEIRKATGVPFWDVLLGFCMREGKIDTKIAQSALLHDPEQKAETFYLQPSDLTQEKLSQLRAAIAPGEGLVLCSRVTLSDGNFMHIPMMDFRCPPSPENMTAIQLFIAKTELKCGILVESGNSYHLYGTSLLTKDQWIKFMAVCMLFAPITDSRYIAHRLADGEARLKIVANDGRMPTIAAVLYV